MILLVFNFDLPTESLLARVFSVEGCYSALAAMAPVPKYFASILACSTFVTLSSWFLYVIRLADV